MGCCSSCCCPEEPDHSTSPLEEQPLMAGEGGGNVGRSARSPVPYGRFVEEALLQHFRAAYAQRGVGMSEEAQIERIKRITAIEELPVTVCDEHILSSTIETNNQECKICMEEYKLGVELRFLPCMHLYHRKCADDWLQRSGTCPECSASILDL